MQVAKYHSNMRIYWRVVIYTVYIGLSLILKGYILHTVTPGRSVTSDCVLHAPLAAMYPNMTGEWHLSHQDIEEGKE